MRIKNLGGKLTQMRFSLSTRIIIAMGGVVLLTAISSIVIFNIIINNQLQEVEAGFRRNFPQYQDYHRPVPATPQLAVEQIKAIVNDSSLSTDAQFTKISQSLRDNGMVSPQVFFKILRDAGMPVSVPQGQDGLSATPPPPPNLANGGPGRLLGGNNGSAEQRVENALLSPVVLSFALGSGVAAILAVVLGFFLSRTVIKPLKALEQASERIADGNYTLQVGPEGKDDVGRLARSFNKMAQALRLTEQKRKDLVADVAHELRTPLSSIQGYTEVLRDGLVPSRERQDEIYDHILNEVRQLTKMVESMRVWMSNEQALDHLNVEEVPAQLAAKMVVERFGPSADHKEIELNLEIEPSAQAIEVRADSDALNHVLSNLVDNALRYTPSGGTIRLKISGPDRLIGSREPVVWFEVEDNGTGISAEHLPFVFERFYRVDKSRDRNTGGTGLGLSIVRDTIQALGGEVRIESQVGVGTCLKFWLPVATPLRRNAGKPLPLLAGSKVS